ncbi:hypothetical protein OQA88_4988 [Cercophora sp. LCS_1]
MDKKTAASGKAQYSRKRKTPAQGSNDSGNQSNDVRPLNSRAQKRVKVHDARNIRSQPPDAALEDGKLDLQKFINAREFEIKALEESRRKCKATSATRAFQQVPRDMRRRTASHNVKRVPKRLRARAKREQLEDNTPTVEARKRRPRTTRARTRAETAKQLELLAARRRKKRLEKAASGAGSGDSRPVTVQARPPRPKIQKDVLNKPPKPTSKYRKRQINKTWLPTHLWHAKRATMTKPNEPLWRFAVPLTSTEKCYRPTHRAIGRRGVVVWDMSYMSTIRLWGSYKGVENVLRALGLTQDSLWGVRGQKWRAGVRTWSGILSKQRPGERRNIGPTTIVWNPESPARTDDQLSSEQARRTERELLIRTHPSCFLELFEELLKLIKMQSPQLHVEDLRFQIGSIELTGPGSTQAILGILKPYYNEQDKQECHAQVFKSLAGVNNPASLPKDALLAFSAKDPRLSYPPRKVEAPRGGEAALMDILTTWPVEKDIKPYSLFDRDYRHQASQLPSQKAVNRRKGSTLPGKEVATTAADHPIPVMLFASRPAIDGQAQGTWTLMAPWACIMPFWYSLVHYPLTTGGNPRLGGLNEQQQVAFEHGLPWFPADFPGTTAGTAWELEQRAKRKQDWDRRPKGKRVEWKSLDLGAGRKGEVGDGLACDFEHLFGLPKAVPTEVPATPAPNDQGAMQMQIDNGLWGVSQIGKKAFDPLVSSSVEPALDLSAVVTTVRITLMGRGVANTCARIYRLPARTAPAVEPSSQAEVPATDPPPPTNLDPLPADLRAQWLQKLPLKAGNANRGKKTAQVPPRMPPGADMATRTRLLGESLLTTEAPFTKPAANQTDIGGYPLCPNKEDLIGFITTGAFSLSEGKATGIGSISAKKALETLKTQGVKEGRLCVVRNAGESVGWLARWETI